MPCYSSGGALIASSAIPSSLEIQHPLAIRYRPIRPADLDVLKEMHEALFPVKYESEFFLNVVNGHGIVSWAAVDTSRPGVQCDEIIGFVTTRVVSTADVDSTTLLGYELSKMERHLVYILTLGVSKLYRNLGIASMLIQKVLDYASGIRTCRAVYLHVISYNLTAIQFYEKNTFLCLQKLPNFYYISEHHYDAYLYIHYVNGGRSPCSALDLLVSVSGIVWSFLSSMARQLWARQCNQTSKWPKERIVHGIPNSFHRTHKCVDSGTSPFV